LVYIGCDPESNLLGLVSFVKFIINNKPEVVIFEATNYFKKYSLFSTVNDFMEDQGYNLDFKDELSIESKYRNVQGRTILYFKRRI